MGKFFGTYERNLDAKNRLLLPSKMMGEMPLRLYLLRGFEGSLSLYPEEAFNAYIEGLEKLSYLDSKARSYVRLAAGSVLPLDVDSHNALPFRKKSKPATSSAKKSSFSAPSIIWRSSIRTPI